MTYADAPEVRNHWYWRPGWHVGARFYTWHITFEDQPEVVDLAHQFRGTLDRQSMLDVVPDKWLHLTMQGMGFVDQIEKRDVDSIVQRAREHCGKINRLQLTLGPPHIDPESIQIAVRPAGAVRKLRVAIRAAIADVWGHDRVPEPAEPFNPHLSLAYVNADGSAKEIAEAINHAPHTDASAAISACQLIILNRDHGMYVWEPYASVQLGQ